MVFEFPVAVTVTVLWSLWIMDQEMVGKHPRKDLCLEKMSQSGCDGSHKLRIGSRSDLGKNQRVLKPLQEMKFVIIKRHTSKRSHREETERDEDGRK